MAARDRGWDVLPAHMGWRLDEDLIKSGVKGVPYGSQTFCEVIAMQMGWKLKANPFNWLATLPEPYLKRKVEFMTLGEAKKLQERKFIKPADDKVFAAAIYNPGTLNTHESIPDDTPTLVSDVVEWDIEYRCFVTPHIVRTWSNYLFYGEINDPRYTRMVNMEYDDPAFFVDQMLSDVPTVPSVVDVGLIKGKGLAIIESNQAWASGIYGCGLNGVLDVLEASCDLY